MSSDVLPGVCTIMWHKTEFFFFFFFFFLLQVHEAHNDQAPCDQVCSNSRPDGGQPAEAECPIIFDFPDDIECVEEEQDMWVQQEEVDEGVEIQQADSGGGCSVVVCFGVMCCVL